MPGAGCISKKLISLEDSRRTEAVELIDGKANLTQSLLERVWCILSVAQDGGEDSFEKGSSGVGGMEDADGGDCDGFGGIQADLGADESMRADKE